MPLLRPSASDYTTVVRALANAGAAVTNPQGSRPPSKGSVALVSAAAISSIIRGSPFRLIQPRVTAAPAVALAPLANAGSTDVFVVKYDSAGTPLWVRRLGGNGTDQGLSVTTDSSGNVIVNGNYSSKPLTIFDTDGITPFATLDNPILNTFETFVVKYNSSGTPQWVSRIGGTTESVNDSGTITIDSSGNIFVVGGFSSNPLTFFGTNGNPTSITLANSGQSDVFVAKYDSNGVPLWARRIGGSLSDTYNTFSTDLSGNIIVSGYYSSSPVTIFDANGNAAFDPLTLIGGQDDGFIVKYSPNGTPLWVRKIAGSSADQPRILLDSSGNIIMFPTSTLQYIYDASQNPITSLTRKTVAKFNTTGTLLWFSSYTYSGTGSSYPTLESIDLNGNIIIGGLIQAGTTLTIDDGTGNVAATFTTTTNTQSYIIKYSPSGMVLWAKICINGPLDFSACFIITDSSENIVVASPYSSNPLTIFNADGSGAFTTLTNSGGNDIFVVKYNSTGTPQWVRRIGGTGAESMRKVNMDSNGNVFVMGVYKSNPLTIFTADGATTFTTLNNTQTSTDDIFVVKYNSNGTPLWARRIGATGAENLRNSISDSTGNIIVIGTYDSNPLTIT